jgi:methylmalonyl-CoA/ethylmalonyl-CoA epimerase
VNELVAAGVNMIDTTPRPGAGGTKIAFIHPRASGRVLTELCQH